MSTSDSESDVAPAPKRRRRSSPSPSLPPSQSDDDASPASDSEEQQSSEYNNSDEEDYNPNASNLFLSLPIEIMDRIVACTHDWTYDFNPHLPSMIATCHAFYQRYHNKVILEGCDGGRGTEKLYFLEDAKKGSFGWMPFIIWNGRATDDERSSHLFGDDEGIDVYMDVIVLDPEQFERDQATNSYFFLRWNDEEVWIDDGYWCTVFLDEVLQISGWTSWKRDLRDSIVKATPELLRERFTCPECDGSGEVEFGSHALGIQWPYLAPEPPLCFIIPCPRCTMSPEEVESMVQSKKDSVHNEVDDE